MLLAERSEKQPLLQQRDLPASVQSPSDGDDQQQNGIAVSDMSLSVARMCQSRKKPQAWLTF